MLTSLNELNNSFETFSIEVHLLRHLEISVLHWRMGQVWPKQRDEVFEELIATIFGCGDKVNAKSSQFLLPKSFLKFFISRSSRVGTC